jgi:hypothetical protein
MEIMQRQPSACVMIDDRDSTHECRVVGHQTIQVNNLEQLKANLAKLGVTADKN